MGAGNRTVRVEGRGERGLESYPVSVMDWRMERRRRPWSFPLHREASSRGEAGATGKDKVNCRWLQRGPSCKCKKLGLPGVATSWPDAVACPSFGGFGTIPEKQISC